MRHLVVLLLLLCLPAHAAGPWQETQPLARAAPGESDDPLNPLLFPVRPLSLSDVVRYRLTICAAPGFQLNGAGTVRLWVYNPALKLWGFNYDNDVGLYSTAQGQRCFTYGVETDVRLGYLLPVTQNVGVSGGTTVTVRVDTDGGK